MSRLWRTASTLTLVACAIPISSAAAASTAVTLDTDPSAKKPEIAIADNGTAYIAWVDALPAAPDTIHYCRLPRGATACDKSLVLTTTSAGETDYVSVLLRANGHVQLVFDRFTGVYGDVCLIESSDGGATFTPYPTPLVVGRDYTGYQSIGGPGANSILTVNGPGSQQIVQAAATNSGTATTAEANLGTEGGYKSRRGITLLDPTTPLVAFNDLTNTYLRRFDKTKAPNYNTAASWLPSVKLSGEAEPSLATTGNGSTYLQTSTALAGSNFGYQVRRISSTDGSVAAPVVASDAVGSIGGGVLTADATGLTSVWVTNIAGGGLRGATAPTGQTFNRPGFIVDPSPDNSFYVPVAATAPDHGGFVVWQKGVGGLKGGIAVAAIAPGGVTPDPEPAPPVAPVDGGGAPSPQPIQDTTTPVLSSVKLARTLKRIGLRKGIVISATSSEPVTFVVQLVVKTKKKGKVTEKVLGSQTATSTGAGTVRVTLKIKGSKLGRGKLKATLRLKATDAAGNTTVTERLVTVK